MVGGVDLRCAVPRVMSSAGWVRYRDGELCRCGWELTDLLGRGPWRCNSWRASALDYMPRRGRRANCSLTHAHKTWTELANKVVRKSTYIPSS
jgi:hypothetical protein